MGVMTTGRETGTGAAVFRWLIGSAVDPDADGLVFACVIAHHAPAAATFPDLAAAAGLAVVDLEALIATQFPGVLACAMDGGGTDGDLPAAARALRGQGRDPLLSRRGRQAGADLDPILREEVEDLRRLLVEYADPFCRESAWMADIVARACLGANHLWQDLALTGRRDLSALMVRHFGGLAALNTGDMKWKKFLYKQLCDREGIYVCKAPNCSVCSDRPHCFGPEIG